MAQIKGILLKAWKDFLKNRYGDQAVQKAFDSLSVEDRMLLSPIFLPSGWYPYSTLHSLRKLTRPLVTSADKDLSVQIGRFMAEYVFTGVYRSLLEKDPVKQVEKFSWIRDFFFQETRKLETEIASNSRCFVRYRYEPGAKPTRAICESLIGFWGMTLELSGASGIRSTHPKCVTTGGDCCEFVFDWQAVKSGAA
jgi:hypothetical protein